MGVDVDAGVPASSELRADARRCPCGLAPRSAFAGMMGVTPNQDRYTDTSGVVREPISDAVRLTMIYFKPKQSGSVYWLTFSPKAPLTLAPSRTNAAGGREEEVRQRAPPLPWAVPDAVVPGAGAGLADRVFREPWKSARASSTCLGSVSDSSACDPRHVPAAVLVSPGSEGPRWRL